MTVTKEETQERLARMRARLSKVDMGGNRGFWSPPSGVSVIRILPEIGTMESFFQEVGKHYIPGGKESITCPDYTSGGKFECPICQLVSMLWRGSDKDKELASKLKLSRAFWINIVVRDKEDKGGDTGSGPFIYTPGITVFGAITSLINGSYGDITDIDTGIDLEVHKKGEKIETKYDVFPRHSRTDIPLHRDDAKLEEFLEKAQDLSWVMLSNNKEEDVKLGEGKLVKLMPYDRMLEEYGIGPDMDVSELDDAKSKPGSVRDTLHQKREEVAFPAEPGYEKAEDEVGQEFNKLRQLRERRKTVN